MRDKFVFAATVAAVLLATSSAFSIVPVSSVTLTPSPNLNMHAPQGSAREATLTVTVGSSGPVTFGTTTFDGDDAGDFSASLDTCAGHKIKAGKTCKVHVLFTPSAVKGTTETAAISINNAANVSLGSDSISGIVTAPLGVYATVAGDVITLHNVTGNEPGMDFTTGGNLSVTGGSCVDVIFPGTCTITVSGKGSIDVEVFENPTKHFVYFFQS